MAGLPGESACSEIPRASRILASIHAFLDSVIKSAATVGGEQQVQAGEGCVYKAVLCPSVWSVNFGMLIYHSNTAIINNDNNDFFSRTFCPLQDDYVYILLLW